MNIKKVLRVSGFILLGVISLLGVLVAFFYYQYQGKYQVDSEKYGHNVGYIDPSNTIQLNKDFELCGKGRLIGYYHSAAPKIYRGTKLEFREFILSNFENNGFSDSGILNLRFHINCDGQVGNMEVNELDNDFEKSSLTEELVDQLIELISQSKNWETFADEDYNYYMYLNFKIEDGNVTEIVP